MSKRHCYCLGKGNEKYVFLYEKGNEHETMHVIYDMIFDESLDFGWDDATIVAFDMIDKLVDERAGGECHQNPYMPSAR